MKIIFVFFGLWFFSGCTDAPKGQSGTAASTPSSTVNSGLSSIFPYEFKFDTIAYMSCSNPAGGKYPAGTFFTFKVGAYNPGAGLKLSSSFIEETKDEKFFKQKEIFNSSYGGSNGKAKWIVQLAIRGTSYSDLGNYLSRYGDKKGVDYGIFFGPSYGEEIILSQLLNKATSSIEKPGSDAYLRYQEGREGVSGRHYFEESLGYTGLSYGDIEDHINTNNYRLSALYTNIDTYGQNSLNLTSYKRGKSFELNISSPNLGEKDKRKLSSVVEYKIEGEEITKETTANWTCGSYMVMRDEDRSRCKTHTPNKPAESNTLGMPSKENTHDSPLTKAMQNIWGSTGLWKFNHIQKCAVYQLDETITKKSKRRAYNICYNEKSLENAEKAEKNNIGTVCFNNYPKDQSGFDTCYSKVFSDEDEWDAYCKERYNCKSGSTVCEKKNYDGCNQKYSSKNGLKKAGKVVYTIPDPDKVSCDSDDSENPSCPHFLSACWR